MYKEEPLRVNYFKATWTCCFIKTNKVHLLYPSFYRRTRWLLFGFGSCKYMHVQRKLIQPFLLIPVSSSLSIVWPFRQRHWASPGWDTDLCWWLFKECGTHVWLNTDKAEKDENRAGAGKEKHLCATASIIHFSERLERKNILVAVGGRNGSEKHTCRHANVQFGRLQVKRLRAWKCIRIPGDYNTTTSHLKKHKHVKTQTRERVWAFFCDLPASPLGKLPFLTLSVNQTKAHLKTNGLGQIRKKPGLKTHTITPMLSWVRCSFCMLLYIYPNAGASPLSAVFLWHLNFMFSRCSFCLNATLAACSIASFCPADGTKVALNQIRANLKSEILGNDRWPSRHQRGHGNARAMLLHQQLVGVLHFSNGSFQTSKVEYYHCSP